MTELGYERFAAQGGDSRASVSTLLGLRHASRIIGIHLNYIPGSYRPDLEPGTRLADIEQPHSTTPISGTSTTVPTHICNAIRRKPQLTV